MFFFCSPAGVCPDPGDCGGDDGDGGGYHLSAEPLPPLSTLPALQTRPHTQEAPAIGQRKSNIMSPLGVLCECIVIRESFIGSIQCCASSQN